jgi:branched-chain amino acid transport system substrate-binding protein
LKLRRSRPLAAAAVVLASIVGLGACSGATQSSGGRHKLDVEIGELVPLSGSEQPWGGPGQKAVNLAVAQIRKAVTETSSNHKISVVTENYRSEPQLAQNLGSKLAEEGASCLIGPWSSASASIVADQLAVPKKVIEISPGASSDALKKLTIGGYFNRMLPPDRVQGQALATMIAKDLGGAKGKKVSIGAIKNVYGAALADTFTGSWENLGGKVSARVIYEPNLPSYDSVARQLVAPKPDAFVFFDFQDTYTRVATALLKTHKWSPARSYAADSLALAGLAQSGGATIEGLRGVAPSWPRLGAQFKTFNRLYQDGPPPRYRQPYDAQAFDGVVLCYLSAVGAGSDSGARMRNWIRRVSSPPGTKYTWRQLPEAIKALEAGKEIDYEGASGPIDIEPVDTTKAASPTAGYYDAYRYANARLGVFGSVAVPAGTQGFKTFPIQYITRPVPGVTPVGATGATGPKGATRKAIQRAKAKRRAQRRAMLRKRAKARRERQRKRGR